MCTSLYFNFCIDYIIFTTKSLVTTNYKTLWRSRLAPLPLYLLPLSWLAELQPHWASPCPSLLRACVFAVPYPSGVSPHFIMCSSPLICYLLRKVFPTLHLKQQPHPPPHTLCILCSTHFSYFSSKGFCCFLNIYISTCLLPWGQGHYSVFLFLLHSICLAHFRHSISVCWMNESINEWLNDQFTVE